MSDMIERVARAMFDASPFRSEEGPFEAQTVALKAAWDAIIDAALKGEAE